MFRWSPPARRPAPHRQKGAWRPVPPGESHRFHHWAVVGTAGEEKAGSLPWTSLQVDGQTQRDDLPVRGEATRMQSPVSSDLHSQRPPSQGTCGEDSHLEGGRRPGESRELAPHAACPAPAPRLVHGGLFFQQLGSGPQSCKAAACSDVTRLSVTLSCPGPQALGLRWSASGGIRHSVNTLCCVGTTCQALLEPRNSQF